MQEGAISKWHRRDITKWRLHAFRAKCRLSEIGLAAPPRTSESRQHPNFRTCRIVAASDRSARARGQAFALDCAEQIRGLEADGRTGDIEDLKPGAGQHRLDEPGERRMLARTCSSISALLHSPSTPSPPVAHQASIWFSASSSGKS